MLTVNSLQLVALALALTAAYPATAEQYWVAWEGNDCPENEGWDRIVDGVGPAIRSLSDGILTIDGLADRQIDDYYRMDRLLNPEPGELFIMQWRFRVNEIDGPPLYPHDPAVNLFSDDDWALALHFGLDNLFLAYEEVSIPYAPAVFHEFEVRSPDMRLYELRLDASTVYQGNLWEPNFVRSRVQWGDMGRGASSLSEWDYFRFGVVPEPGTCIAMVAMFSAITILKQNGRNQ